MGPTYETMGLGSVAVADTVLANIDRTRFMPFNSRARRCQLDVILTGTTSNCKIRPVYMHPPPQGSGMDMTQMDRFEDPAQEVTATADGQYTFEFKARPGMMMAFKVHALAAVTPFCDMRGQYLDTV